MCCEKNYCENYYFGREFLNPSQNILLMSVTEMGPQSKIEEMKRKMKTKNFLEMIIFKRSVGTKSRSVALFGNLI